MVILSDKIINSSSAGVAQPPVLESFPSSPHVVAPSDTIMLQAELSTTHFSVYFSWYHKGNNYSDFIFEDPFCNPQLEVYD